MVNKVLFVCTGNICRSPMAEGIFNKKCSDEFIGISAGTHAPPGHAASEKGMKLLKEKDIDISDHKSQELSYELLDEVDYVFYMSDDHIYDLRRYFPKYEKKYFKLNENDVVDPYMGEIEEYGKALLEIEKGIDRIINDLK